MLVDDAFYLLQQNKSRFQQKNEKCKILSYDIDNEEMECGGIRYE